MARKAYIGIGVILGFIGIVLFINLHWSEGRARLSVAKRISGDLGVPLTQLHYLGGDYSSWIEHVAVFDFTSAYSDVEHRFIPIKGDFYIQNRRDGIKYALNKSALNFEGVPSNIAEFRGEDYTLMSAVVGREKIRVLVFFGGM